MMVMLGDGDWLERRWRMEAEEERSKSPRKKEKKTYIGKKKIHVEKQGNGYCNP